MNAVPIDSVVSAAENQVYSAADAHKCMMSGKARFRVVIDVAANDEDRSDSQFSKKGDRDV